MAGLWETIRESARAAVFGPAPSPMLAPQPRVEQRALGIGTGIPNHLVAGQFTTLDYVRAGGLVHGPGASDILRRAYEQGYDLGAVASICLFRLMTDFPQAPLTIYRLSAGDKRDPLPGHPLAALLHQPNAHLNGDELLAWTSYVLNAHGNAYWEKVRAGHPETGNVIELWPLSPAICWPVREKGSPNFIDYYVKKLGPSKNDEVHIPLENLVHFRFGLSDGDPRLGISRLRRVIREICTEQETSDFVLRLLKNNAIPGAVVTLPADVQMSREAKETMKADLAQRFGGENVGAFGVMDGGGTIVPLGFDPKQLDMSVLTNQAQALICAAMGVPAQVAGIPAGLEHQTFANFDQAQESYTELTLLPQYKLVARKIRQQLLPDFTSRADEVADFDLRFLRALQEDEDALSARVVQQWQADLIKRDAALSMLGKDMVGGPEGEQYYSQFVAQTGTAAIAAAPAPAEGRGLGIVGRQTA